MKQADDLLPRLQAFGAQEHVFFMNDRLQQEEVKVAGWDAKIKGSIEYFRKLRKDGLDVRKPIPSALRKLDKDKETLKGLLEKLQESGGDLNSIRTALDDAQLSEVEENFKNSFSLFTENINNALKKEQKKFLNKMQNIIPHTPGNPNGLKMGEKLRDAKEEVNSLCEVSTKDLQSPKVKEVLDKRKKWDAGFKQWEKLWPELDKILGSIPSGVRKFLKDAASESGAKLSSFDDEIKKHLETQESLDTYVIRTIDS